MNYLFYMPETLRAEGLACYGNPVVQTPNFDRLAKEGVRFSQAHVQNTVCGPSRCSLMTGWPVHVHGHRSLYYFLQPDEPNLFRYLRQDGYDVFWYGKNDLLAPASFADSVTEWGPRPARAKPRQNPWPFSDRRYYSFLYGEGGGVHDTADWANVSAAMRILERDSAKPFCLYLPLSYAHPPFTAPKDFYHRYKPSEVPPLRPVDLPRKPNYYEAIRRTRRLTEMTDADFRQIQAVYLGMISYSDWMLGELLATLERTGHDKDTVVFVFSDHGEWGGDYGLVEKWPSACDGVLEHVPLIVRLPPGMAGAARGHVSKEIVELYDVMATCLELSGISARHTHFARSLLPQLHGNPGDPHRAAFCEGGYNVNEPQCFEPMDSFSSPANIYYPKVMLQNRHPETVTRATMIHTGEYKLVLRPDGQGEFYDLKRDPRELHNVYGDRSYARPQESLHTQILDWYIRTADVAPKRHDPRGFPKPPS
ncbi:MAG: sulfatase-like hydrolase/transferase [Bryobacteraceae bacterium]